MDWCVFIGQKSGIYSFLCHRITVALNCTCKCYSRPAIRKLTMTSVAYIYFYAIGNGASVLGPIPTGSYSDLSVELSFIFCNSNSFTQLCIAIKYWLLTHICALCPSPP